MCLLVFSFCLDSQQERSCDYQVGKSLFRLGDFPKFETIASLINLWEGEARSARGKMNVFKMGGGKSPNHVPTNIRLSPTVLFVCAIGWKK
jgi:hypothetical protein